jgi:hypothetical protein
MLYLHPAFIIRITLAITGLYKFEFLVKIAQGLNYIKIEK